MQQPRDRTIPSLTTAHRGPNGKFRNPWPGASPHGLRDLLKWAWGRRRVQRACAENWRVRPVARTASISAAPAPSGFDANA